MDRVELKVYGITYNQVKEGAYVLLLTDETELFRIPIVIGVAEAQSIAVHMKKVEPQRPLTHDIYCSTLTAFGITLDEVFIYKFADGIFYSELHYAGRPAYRHRFAHVRRGGVCIARRMPHLHHDRGA